MQTAFCLADHDFGDAAGGAGGQRAYASQYRHNDGHPKTQ